MAAPIEISAHSAGATAVAPSPSYIWSAFFDYTLLIAPASLGLLAAAVVTSNPALYVTVLIADLWFLGYHHVWCPHTRAWVSALTAFGRTGFW